MSEQVKLYAFSIMATLEQPNTWELRTGNIGAQSEEYALGVVYLTARKEYPDSRNIRVEVMEIPRERIEEVVESWEGEK